MSQDTSTPIDAMIEVNLDEVTMSSLRKRVAQDLRVEIRGDDKDWRGPEPATASSACDRLPYAGSRSAPRRASRPRCPRRSPRRSRRRPERRTR